MSFFHSHQISNRNLHSPSNCYLQSSSKALVKWPML
jgi:dolichyl-phosphate-mannose--protein O-mannosyl transferase